MENYLYLVAVATDLEGTPGNISKPWGNPWIEEPFSPNTSPRPFISTGIRTPKT